MSAGCAYVFLCGGQALDIPPLHTHFSCTFGGGEGNRPFLFMKGGGRKLKAFASCELLHIP